MRKRTLIEQEMFEQFIAQGMSEFEADEIAHEVAIDQGEYDDSLGQVFE